MRECLNNISSFEQHFSNIRFTENSDESSQYLVVSKGNYFSKDFKI